MLLDLTNHLSSRIDAVSAVFIGGSIETSVLGWFKQSIKSLNPESPLQILVLLPNTSGGQVKKQGNHVDISEFRSQLDALGLKFIQVTADGNCFFRALADQLEGNEEEHNKYRSMAVHYIQRHREMFEPFIEDDVPFDEYCQSMEKDGTWAGHMELQAASLVTHCNICIHRLTSPRWYIRNFNNREARMIHLSYHNEEHYNSVRSKEDPCNGPAKSIVIKADADLPSTPYLTKAAVTRECSESIADTGSIKMVMAGSGCENAKKVEQLLQQLNGDVDAAIEFLIAEQGTDEDLVENDELPCHSDASAGHNENGECEQSEATVDNTSKHGQSNNSIKLSHAGSNPQTNHKKIPRNKVCPCGSRKKYKACCGSGMRRSTEFVINQKVSSSKGSKERKKGRKGQSLMTATSHGSEGEPPDMGALCI